MRLENKVALVSGGASGIGAAIVARFAREGAQVFFGDLDETKGKLVAEATGSTFMKLDVSREDDWEAAVDIVASAAGRLDILVNNAGILGSPAMIEDMNLNDWNQVMTINVTGTMLGCKHGSRLMLRNPEGASGSIINLSSISGILASPGPGYPTSKGAVRLLTKAVAADFAHRSIAIRCNSIHPGAVETPIFAPWRQGTEDQLQKADEALKLMIPMNRLGRPDEIAAMALFLASEESSFSTGSEFIADGGGTCTMPSKRTGSWML